MNKASSLKIGLAVICIVIVGVSIAIYAVAPDTVLGVCSDRCDIFHSIDTLNQWFACMDGCLEYFAHYY